MAVLTQFAKDVAKKIGQFYLEKNGGDYETTNKELTVLNIINIELLKTADEVNNLIIIRTARPGLLIGKHAQNIDNLSKFLEMKIRIIEEEDSLLFYMMLETPEEAKYRAYLSSLPIEKLQNHF